MINLILNEILFSENNLQLTEVSTMTITDYSYMKYPEIGFKDLIENFYRDSIGKTRTTELSSMYYDNKIYYLNKMNSLFQITNDANQLTESMIIKKIEKDLFCYIPFDREKESIVRENLKENASETFNYLVNSKKILFPGLAELLCKEEDNKKYFISLNKMEIKYLKYKDK